MSTKPVLRTLGLTAAATVTPVAGMAVGAAPASASTNTPYNSVKVCLHADYVDCYNLMPSPATTMNFTGWYEPSTTG